jgi:Tfp pilus assembly protein PilO
MSVFKPGRWSDREKGVVLLTAGVLLVAAAYLVVWRPTRHRLAELDARIQVAGRELADYRRLLASDLRNAVAEEYGRYGERLRSTLSAAEENAALLRSLEELATRVGISLVATRPQEMVPRNDHEEYGVELEVEGDTPRMMAFFHGIYAASALLRVSSFEVERKDKAAPMKGRIRVTKAVTR